MFHSKTLSGSFNSSPCPAGHPKELSFTFQKELSFTFPHRASCFRYSLCTRKAFVNPLRHRFNCDTFSLDGNATGVEKKGDATRSASDDGIGFSEGRRISGIHVPRTKHISISKAGLLEAILEMFDQEDVLYFRKFSVCLDYILHAEHKGILEEMRSYYSPHLHDPIQRTKSLTQPAETTFNRHHSVSNGSMKALQKGTNFPSNAEDDKPLYLHDSFDLMSFFGYFSGKADRKSSMDSPRIAVTNHFQQSFMKLLYNAQFEELSAEDLLLTKALNSDYLLTLPIYVDWKRASESHAIIFRRGYATERQKGLLIAEKLDYLQSKLLQGIFSNISRPLKEFGVWLYEALNSFSMGQRVLTWIDALKLLLKDQYSLERTLSYREIFPGNQPEPDSLRDSDLPIWLAAQRAVHRYEGFLSLVGPRGRLMKELLTWAGLVPLTPEFTINLYRDAHYSETVLRPNFLQRITLSNLWEPASREYCGENVWKMLRTAISILFSSSILQEPAFEELILLYTEEPSQREDLNEDFLQLHLKIYEKIPIPDLPVIFPHKKLSFRILDTVRLDIASILGLLAFILNYKFENILSSPSAVFLDVIATTALIAFVSRIVLGYKQTWDRYQLLVNRTLYERTLASGFGSVYFLLDASEQQQYKEAILLYAILLKLKKIQVRNRKSIGAECELFLHEKFKEQIEMPVDKAMDTLLRLGVISEFPLEEDFKIEVISCSKACETLRKRWNDLLDLQS